MISLRLRWIGFTFFGATVLTASYAIIQSLYFNQHPDLIAFASTLDIIIIIPLSYLLFTRPSRVPAITVVPVFVVCAATASFIIPTEFHHTLEILVMGVELTVITLLVSQALRIRKQYRSLRSRSSDFYDSLHESLCRVILFERVARILLTEVSLFYYSTVGWSSKSEEQNSFPRFTTYKESGYPLVASVLVILLCLETILVHFFLVQWSPIAAWIVTGLSAYALVFFFGDLNSLRRRPLIITESGIALRVGIRWNVFIPFENIRHVTTTRIPSLAHENYFNVALLRNSNCIIHLHDPVTISGLYGIRKTATSIAMSIDDVQRFASEVSTSMEICASQSR